MTCPKDGSTNIFRPVTQADWTSLSLPVPDYRVRTDGSGPNMIDDVVGLPWTPVGAVQYQQTHEAGYASLGVGFTDAGAMGFTLPVNRGYSCLTQATMIYLKLFVRSLPAATFRAVWTWGGSSEYVSIFTSAGAKMSVRGTGTPTGFANGTIDYHDGHTHGLIITTIPGALVIAHAGAGVYSVRTDKETLTPSFPYIGDTGTKGPGTAGAGVITTPDIVISDWAIWRGSKAETLYNAGAGPKATLQALGHTVTP